MNKLYFRTHKKFLFLLFVAGLTILTPFTYNFPSKASAAELTNRKVTISDSRAGVAADHTFTFTKGATSTTAIKTIEFLYCTESATSGTCTAPTGMILTATPTLGTVTGIAGTTYAAAGTSANCTGTGNTQCKITVTVTTPAAETGGSATVVPVTSGITNPTTTNTSYYVRITTLSAVPATIDGPSVVAFGILTTTSIAVSASVDSTFTFTVAGVASGGTIGADTTDITTTANTIPFGTLVSITEKQGASDATVTTNADNGYQVTVKALATPPLVGSADATNNIDAFSGTNAVPTAWSQPAGTAASVDTGFFGYTTNDTTLSNIGNGINRFTTATLYAGTTTTAAEVGFSAGPTGSSGDTIRVGWQAEVNAVQTNDNYTGTVIMVATPTY